MRRFRREDYPMRCLQHHCFQHYTENRVAGVGSPRAQLMARRRCLRPRSWVVLALIAAGGTARRVGTWAGASTMPFRIDATQAGCNISPHTLSNAHGKPEDIGSLGQDP